MRWGEGGRRLESREVALFFAEHHLEFCEVRALGVGRGRRLDFFVSCASA
ncbi:hypothetical protein GLE_3681 [Lysobacter enzymogenes]|uniref:Uncharacterized protein n=1 Tax=Lysobacter enzymogenes TaxID=69 RepID=A0A0S2DKT4_LYSEN|nr:hypothetical protein GLE_3681 [Lysobacter enzymogenes]